MPGAGAPAPDPYPQQPCTYNEPALATKLRGLGRATFYQKPVRLAALERLPEAFEHQPEQSPNHKREEQLRA